MNNNNPSFFDRLNSWLRNSITVHLLSVGVLILILLIPASMIQDLIREREYRMEEAINEVSSKWGGPQTLAGPILTVPYYKYSKDNYDRLVKTIDYAHFLPEEINIEGSIAPEMRYRGIYEVVVYSSAMNVKGKFKKPDFSEWSTFENDIIWKDAFLSLGISDMRGIKENILVNWNENSFALNPGIETKDVLESGLSARIPVNAADSASSGFTFSFDLKLNGSKLLNFVPVGKENDIKISSSWPSPSFDGNYLPDERNISESGFDAQWKVLHLNRNYPQQWKGNAQRILDSEFGVTLLLPVDEYQKTTRSAKYAIMFIALTFLIFFFVEILNKKRIHPVQYLLVGLGLCIFYTLLLSLSEHIGFGIAYIVASIAVVLLITFYTSTILLNKRLTAITGLVLTVLYGFIYTIIQLEDYALLMGSIGLFLVLTILMYLSRKIKWYGSEDEK